MDENTFNTHGRIPMFRKFNSWNVIRILIVLLPGFYKIYTPSTWNVIILNSCNIHRPYTPFLELPGIYVIYTKNK